MPSKLLIPENCKKCQENLNLTNWTLPLKDCQVLRPFVVKKVTRYQPWNNVRSNSFSGLSFGNSFRSVLWTDVVCCWYSFLVHVASRDRSHLQHRCPGQWPEYCYGWPPVENRTWWRVSWASRIASFVDGARGEIYAGLADFSRKLIRWTLRINCSHNSNCCQVEPIG